MTRFARSKGSKASNERLPEEATPWSEMKKQLLEKSKELEENKSRQDAFEKRNANYKNFLEDKEKVDSKNASWAEFPDTVTVKNKKKKKLVSSKNNASNQNNTKTYEQENDVSLNVKKSKNDAPLEGQSSKKDVAEPVVNKKKKIKSKKLLKTSEENNDNDNSLAENKKTGKKRKATENLEVTKKKLKKYTSENDVDSIKNKQDTKGNKQKKKIVKENLTEQDLKKIEKKKQKRIKQLEKKKRIKAELEKQKEEQKKTEENSETSNKEVEDRIPNLSFDKSLNKNVYPKKPFIRQNNKVMEKKKKVRDNEEHSRKKPLLPHKMFINGKELEIDYVDGFPVKKEDALRLKKLRKEMISKGLPRSEINFALKLERRKAEKAFAREKKKVCFHCRKSGHNLSECPNIDKNEVAQTTASGICFKCGSTEHTHFECKVVRGQEFKYATCFICKEQGHIARQCPDNARGLYPKGGACKVCGDVTHLKKDCPKYQAQQQKQEENMRVETFGSSNPDILEDKTDDRGGAVGSKRPNKIIKF